MFAAVGASGVSVDTLVDVAAGFTPRFEVAGRLVLLDVHGVSRLFGEAGALACALHDAVAARGGMPLTGAAGGAASPPASDDGPRVALAASTTAALLGALAHRGITVIASGEEGARLAPLSLEVLVAFAHLRLASEARDAVPTGAASSGAAGASATAGGSEVTRSSGPGWRHPRDTHQAQHTRRPRVAVGLPEDRVREARRAIAVLAATFRRWGVRTLGAVAALPRADVHARLGERGVMWQRWAAGVDEGVLVPWVAEPVFEAAMDLEWPIDGLEPLSFVLARLFEPLAAQLERADRGAAAIQTALGLTTRAVHLRTIPLPAPIRDPKTLRTLVLLDLESHAPPAAVDRVHVLLDPTPARVLQWTLFTRAQPAPEQTATLLARLTALMGDGHVGSPEVVDTWKPGAFRMGPWGTRHSHLAPGTPHSHSAPGTPHSALPLAFRRFRLPIPVRVRVEDGRPVRVMTDRRGLTGGPIVQAAGPWRTSGAWWEVEPCRESGGGSRETGGEEQRGQPAREAPAFAEALAGRPASRLPARPEAWDRDEWDIAMADGTVYRLSVERSVGQWFLEGIVD